MQKDLPETATRQMRRASNASTPELPKKTNVNNVANSRANSSRHRLTMASLELLHLNTQTDIFPEREVGMDSMSMVQSQMSSKGSRLVAVDSDNDSLQSELLYDMFLEGTASIECLREKKEMKQKIDAMLAAITKETDCVQEKCSKLKDMVQSSTAIHETDSQTADCCHSNIKHNKMRAFADLLFRLHTYLKLLHILDCHNIILPTTAEEWDEIERILRKCFITLQSIAKLIGSKTAVRGDIYNAIKVLLENHSEVDGYQKRVQKTLYILQILVLKVAMLSAKENNNIDI